MSREEAEQNQKERLFAAMVAVTAEKGYQATSITDLVEIAGVSSRTFYQHFADKEECFLAAMEVILANMHRLVLGELEGDGSIDERAERAALALIQNLIVEPETTRLWLVEAFCAGDRAQQRLTLALDILAAQMQKIFVAVGKENMPEELVRAILGGLAGVVYNRLVAGKAEDVPALVEKLRDWALGYPSPPGPLRPKGRRRNSVPPSGAPPFAAHVPGERVVRAFADVVAVKGYAATTIADIAAGASVSQATIYHHFSGKEDILDAALDSSGAQMIAATLPAIRRTPEWPVTMRVAAETLCAFFVAEPAFAHLREVAVYSAGPSAVRLRDQTGHELLEMLTSLAPEATSGLDQIRVEATFASLHALLYRRIRTKGVKTLPQVVPMATYLALAPWIGGEAAWDAALS